MPTRSKARTRAGRLGVAYCGLDWSGGDETEDGGGGEGAGGLPVVCLVEGVHHEEGEHKEGDADEDEANESLSPYGEGIIGLVAGTAKAGRRRA